jgi:hypothetical protein
VEQRLGGKESSNGEEAKLEKAAGVLSGQGVKETWSSVGQGLSPSLSLAAKARRGRHGKAWRVGFSRGKVVVSRWLESA